MAAVRLSVYRPDGTTLIAHIPRRRNLSWMDELNVPGSAKFDIHLGDPVLAEHPDLLDEFNIFKIYVNGAAVKAFQIEDLSPVWLGSGERADNWVAVSGRGILSVLEAAVVYPEYGLRENTPDDRQFDFSSADGVWRIPSEWVAPVGVRWADETTSRAGYPTDWPDPDAEWIWPINPTFSSPPGRCWFRGTFTLATATEAILYATADNGMSVRLDGQILLANNPTATTATFRETFKTSVYLAAGQHTIAAWVDNYARTPTSANPTGSNPAGFICTLYQADDTGEPTAINIFRSNDSASWIVKPYGNAPGWTAATVLQQCIIEAQARNVEAVKSISFDFTATLDSNDESWSDIQDRSVKIGTTDLWDLAQQLIELSMDLDLDPNFVLKAWKTRGGDRRTTVRLLPNRDLTSSTSTIRASKLRNQALLRYEGGWLELYSSSSKEAYGRREVGLQVGNAGSTDQLVLVGAAAMREVSRPEVTVPFSYTSVRGHQPYVDYYLGDVITCPNHKGVLAPARVMAISGSEDDTGAVIRWDIDVYPELPEDSISTVTIATGGTMGDPSGLYQAAVLSDSPWGYWRLKETQGVSFADLSGAARTMTLSGSAHTFNQAGPVDKAAAFSTAAGFSRTNATFGFQYATLEAWVNPAAAPTSPMAIIGMASTTNGATNSWDKNLYYGSNGRVGLYVYNGSAGVTLSSPAAIPLNQWTHVVASVGALGMRLYINGVLVSSSTTTKTSFVNPQHVMIRGGGTLYDHPGALKIAEPAVYYQQLLDSRVKVHFDAAAAQVATP